MSSTFPDDWNVKKIENLSVLITKGATPTTYGYNYIGILNGAGIKFIRGNNASLNGKFLGKEIKFICPDAHNKLKRSQLQSGDVIISIVGSVGASFQVDKSTLPGNINQNVALIRPNYELNSSYLKQVIISPIIQDKINQELTVQAQPSLSLKQVGDFEIPAPPLPEQQKIAKILTSVDEVIEKTQAQIDKLKDLKTGMIQELLSNGIGHTEFKDSPVGRIPAQWEVKPLSALIDVMESGWSPQCESYPAVAGEWGVLKTTSVKWEGFNFRENKKLPEFLEPRLTAQVEHKDILITRAGPAERVGVVAYVDKVPKKIMLSDKIIRLKTKDSCNPKFLSLWLSCDTTKQYVASRISGLAQSQTNISQDILKRCPCVVPPIYEQEVIALTLSSIEKRHNQLTLKLAQLKSAKKALMQDLLTGKVRVKVDSE